MVAKKNGKAGFNEGSIFIKRARENNLKNLTVELPRGKLIGVKVTRKSSLVFDVMAMEGHRKYVESLSYKQGRLWKKLDPKGFSKPFTSTLIGQAYGSSGPRSTCRQQIADYARLLGNCRNSHHSDGSRVSQRSLMIVWQKS